MDFVCSLPKTSKGHNAIWVIVDSALSARANDALHG